MSLKGKTILITGSVRRIGRAMAFAVAGAGANVVLHYRHSEDEPELNSWNRHMMVNLTAPFMLSQAFARAPKPPEEGGS